MSQVFAFGIFEKTQLNQLFDRVCSIKCVNVKSIKLNNFDHYGKTTIEKERKENAFGRNNS